MSSQDKSGRQEPPSEPGSKVVETQRSRWREVNKMGDTLQVVSAEFFCWIGCEHCRSGAGREIKDDSQVFVLISWVPGDTEKAWGDHERFERIIRHPAGDARQLGTRV